MILTKILKKISKSKKFSKTFSYSKWWIKNPEKRKIKEEELIKKFYSDQSPSSNSDNEKNQDN